MERIRGLASDLPMLRHAHTTTDDPQACPSVGPGHAHQGRAREKNENPDAL
jgi:hypothetical protein